MVFEELIVVVQLSVVVVQPTVVLVKLSFVAVEHAIVLIKTVSVSTAILLVVFDFFLKFVQLVPGILLKKS